MPGQKRRSEMGDAWRGRFVNLVLLVPVTAVGKAEAWGCANCEDGVAIGLPFGEGGGGRVFSRLGNFHPVHSGAAPGEGRRGIIDPLSRPAQSGRSFGPVQAEPLGA